MCGRFILVQKLEKIASRFGVEVPGDLEYKPGFNISPGNYSLVITNRNPDKLESLRFGLTPFWSKKNMMLINARAEGDRNKENKTDYRGGKDIINKPAFRKPVRSQRCLVIADAFIEGSTQNGLDEPYVVYLRGKKRPFAFAGIWDTWKNPVSGEVIEGFSIITTTPNSLLKKIPHHRSPVILSKGQEKLWIKNDTPLTDITACLNPYPSKEMNAYPVNKNIKDPRKEGRQLIEPVGEPLLKEDDVEIRNHLTKQGFGRKDRYF